jgi:hypothetical protein
VSCSESDLTDIVSADCTVNRAESGHFFVSRGWALSTHCCRWTTPEAKPAEAAVQGNAATWHLQATRALAVALGPSTLRQLPCVKAERRSSREIGRWRESVWGMGRIAYDYQRSKNN